MAEDQKIDEQKTSDEVVEVLDETAPAIEEAMAKIIFGPDKNKVVDSGDNRRGGANRGGGAGGRGGRGERGNRRDHSDEMPQRLLEVARVTRVMKGGKRMSFRACVAIGDKKGSIGIGLGKGADVTMAVNKAVNQAKKHMLKVVTVKDTIPHAVDAKFGASKILFKPAKQGRGVIAGGVVRVILELAGVKNITSKILGGNNKINNARCTLAALKKLRKVEK